MRIFAVLSAIAAFVVGAPALADERPYEELVIAGEAAPNGVYDPSLEYGPDGVGWMAYSEARLGRTSGVVTAIARSDDEGANWRRVVAVNPLSPARGEAPDGKVVAGVWTHEVPSLVFDPDDPGREWKLYWHRYLHRHPSRGPNDRQFSLGWIAYRHAPSPQGPWSDEIALIGAGPFPPPPHRTLFNIGELDPEWRDYIVLTELGTLYWQGALYLSLQAVRIAAGTGGRVLADTILLSSRDHGATWRAVATPLRAEDARAFGGDWFTGSSIAVENDRIFLLVCPEVRGESLRNHRGTVVFEFDDIDRGTLRRDADGDLLVIRRLETQLMRGGQADYDARNTAGGIVMPQLHMRNLPRPLRIYNTGVAIIDK